MPEMKSTSRDETVPESREKKCRRLLRVRAVMSQEQLADRSGVARDTISKLETGQRRAYPSTIRKLAQLVNTPVEKLLEQLAQAGMKFSGPDQVVTSAEKVKLLGFLRRSHGKDEPVADEADAAPKKITLSRRTQQEVTVNAGRSKTTVNVEVRQKRTYVKDGARAMTPDEERADILRKLEESRARNLAEQQALAEKDRLRDEAIVRAREEEAAAKERAEAEIEGLGREGPEGDHRERQECCDHDCRAPADALGQRAEG